MAKKRNPTGFNKNGRPTQKTIKKALDRYDYMINSFEFLIDELEEKYKNNPQWYTWSVKSAKKFLTHSRTIQNLLTQKVHILKYDEKIRFIDFSSVFTLLRVQIENYAVFNHLFVTQSSIEERMLRFGLWQLDGLKSRNKHKRPGTRNLEEEEKEYNLIISGIEKLKYFQTLKQNRKKYLIKNYQWKFTDESLKNSNKNKWKLSIEQIIANTEIKNNVLFDNWYSFTSTHTHTSFWSVVEHDTHTLDKKILAQYISLMQGLTVIACFFFDLCKKFRYAQEIFDVLPEADKITLKSFDERFKNE